MKQEFISENTSINRRLPAIFKHIDVKDKEILDYGCGKYPEYAEEYVTSHGGAYYCYDIYYQPQFPYGTYDIVVLSNVLNVIKEDAIVLDILKTCKSTAKEVAIWVYEGDKSGVGKPTGKGRYQRNQPTQWYIDFLTEHGYSPIRKGKMIII